MKLTRSQSGFSLVELSIVLVILGLLTGGILGGQALIRAAELRSVSTDYQRFSAAVMTFRDKYFALPGDMTNATAFWGAADGNDGRGSDCRAAQTLDRRTCNGNGDGIVRPHPDLEDTRFWQQLSNAELIEGNYIGTGTAHITACSTMNPGCVVPGSKLNSGLWTFFISDTPYIYSTFQNRNALVLSTSPWATRTLSFVMNAEEMWNIDTKLDDGLPGTGVVTASRIMQCDNAVNGSDIARINARYRLNNSSRRCVPYFLF